MLFRFATTFAVVVSLVGCGKDTPAPQPPAGEPTGPEVAPAPRVSGLNPLQVFDRLESAKRDTAQTKCQVIKNAILAYMLKPQTQGMPPQTLEILVTGDLARGIGPMLDGGQEAVVDPWGKPFAFEMASDGYRDVPRVTTTGPDGKPIYSKKWESQLKPQK